MKYGYRYKNLRNRLGVYFVFNGTTVPKKHVLRKEIKRKKSLIIETSKTSRLPNVVKTQSGL